MPRVEDVEAYAQASESAILSKARDVVEEEVEKTNLFEVCASVEEKIPRFHSNEMVLGRVVGRGGFCVVRELCEIKLRCETNGVTLQVPEERDAHFKTMESTQIEPK